MAEPFDLTPDPQGGVALQPQGALSAADLGIAPPLAQTVQPIPPAPPPPAGLSQPLAHTDPRQQLLAIAALGALLGGGARNGIGTGLAQGVLGGQQQIQAARDAMLLRQQKEDEERQKLLQEQQRAEQANQRQRQVTLQNALITMQKRVADLPDKPSYDKEVSAFTNILNTSGYRLGENDVRRMVPYTAPDAQKIAAKAVDAFLKNPANQQLITQHPDQLSNVVISMDVDGDGIPEQVPLLRAAQIGRVPFSVDGTGTLISYPKGTTVETKANADAIYADLEKQAQAEGKDINSPRVTIPLRQQAIRLAAQAKPEPTVVMQTVDDQGNPVSRIVEKKAGTELRKAPSGQTEARLASAKAVNQTGDDIIRQLSDPSVAAVVGPIMGRASSLRDLIGNPPPEFSQLAGQIESYALANMGVHGMRSSQGAEQIKRLLDAHHTPESLIAAIRGLQGFSNHFIQNEGGGTSTAPAAAPTMGGLPTYQDYLRSKGAR